MRENGRELLLDSFTVRRPWLLTLTLSLSLRGRGEALHTALWSGANSSLPGLPEEEPQQIRQLGGATAR